MNSDFDSTHLEGFEDSPKMPNCDRYNERFKDATASSQFYAKTHHKHLLTSGVYIVLNLA
jgi:hypothetical protein